ncbi:unnamed protein product [Ectocarpus sp. 12 AP-2014]
MRFANLVSVVYSFASKAHAMFATPQYLVKLRSPALLTSEHLRIAAMCRDVYCESTEACEMFVSSPDTGAEATVRLITVNLVENSRNVSKHIQLR